MMDIPEMLADRKGVTLIELLISITILSIIVAVLASTFGVGIRAWETGGKRGEDLCTYRITVDRLERDLKSIYPYMLSTGFDAKKKCIAFAGFAHELKCVSLAPSFTHTETPFGVKGLHYFVVTEGEDEEKGLMLREIFPPEESFFKDVGSMEIPQYCVDPSVTAINFEYYTRETQEKESIQELLWESEYNLFSISSVHEAEDTTEEKKALKELPAAIRVSLQFVNEKGEEEIMPPLTIPIMVSSPHLQPEEPAF